MTSTAWLIRHAESEANAGLPTDAPDTVVLTEDGMREAAKFAMAFPVKPSLIVCSRFTRSIQTAAPLIRRFPDVPVETWTVEEFTYLPPGDHHGTTMVQRKEAVEAYWGLADPAHVSGKDAETFTQLILRAEQMVDQLRRRRLPHVAVVCHGIFIRAVLWRLLMPDRSRTLRKMAAFRTFQLSLPTKNLSITKLRFEADGEVLMGAPFSIV